MFDHAIGGYGTGLDFWDLGLDVRDRRLLQSALTKPSVFISWLIRAFDLNLPVLAIAYYQWH